MQPLTEFVLDLTACWLVCTMVLGDLGADVISEPPEGDETRGWGRHLRASAIIYVSITSAA